MQAILFDFDRTLWDTDEGIYDCNKHVAQIFGITNYPSYNEYHALLHLHWHKIYAHVGIHPETWDEADHLFSQFLPEFTAESKPFLGIEELIPSLAERNKLAIVSSSFRHAIEPLLQKYNLRDCFSALIDWYTKPHKPNPHPVYEALVALHAKNSNSCFIGDAQDDILAGKAAGLAKVYGAAWNTLSKERVHGADAIFSSPKELEKILNNQ